MGYSKQTTITMKASEKQLFVMRYLFDKGEVSKSRMMEELEVGRWYYCNAEKHFGEILSRMVNSGFIIRAKKGVYKLKETQTSKSYISPDQISLF
jgi:hypothetical protein